jgi:hypothetical protein
MPLIAYPPNVLALSLSRVSGNDCYVLFSLLLVARTSASFYIIKMRQTT